MEKNSEYNIVVLGVSCFDGMASSTRVRNLLEPLINEDLLTVSNLIYEKEANGLVKDNGDLKGILYRVFRLKKTNILSLIKFLWNGMKFIKVCKSNSLKNILYSYGYPDIKNILFLLFAKLIGYKIIFDIVEDNRYFTKFQSKLNRFKIFSSILLLKLSPFIANTVITISD